MLKLLEQDRQLAQGVLPTEEAVVGQFKTGKLSHRGEIEQGPESALVKGELAALREILEKCFVKKIELDDGHAIENESFEGLISEGCRILNLIKDELLKTRDLGF